MEDKNKSGISALLHTPYAHPDPYGALSMPVYHCAAYEFSSAEQMELAFTGKSPEHAYSRISNPTVQYFEERIKQMTGAMSVTALNSGMAAISNAILTLASAGSNIVTTRHLFGNTYSLFASTLASFGVEVRFCDLTNLQEVENNIDENTCAVFFEIISNPQLEIIDLRAVSELCKNKGVPVVADTTIVPFCGFKASGWGIDIEIVSSTKYISGGATCLGGLILDYGTFNWEHSSKLLPLVAEFGQQAFTMKLKKEIHRNLGAYMTPQVAYMQSLGLETLHIRYEKAVSNCLLLAIQLQTIEEIKSVNYPGLSGNPFHSLALCQFENKPGAMLTIDLASKEQCYSMMNRLKLIKRATNLFDNKSLAIHPASTIFGNFSPAVRASMNVADTTIRLSIGLECVDDLVTDILQALRE